MINFFISIVLLKSFTFAASYNSPFIEACKNIRGANLESSPLADGESPMCVVSIKELPLGGGTLANLNEKCKQSNGGTSVLYVNIKTSKSKCSESAMTLVCPKKMIGAGDEAIPTEEEKGNVTP